LRDNELHEAFFMPVWAGAVWVLPRCYPAEKNEVLWMLATNRPER